MNKKDRDLIRKLVNALEGKILTIIVLIGVFLLLITICVVGVVTGDSAIMGLLLIVVSGFGFMVILALNG